MTERVYTVLTQCKSAWRASRKVTARNFSASITVLFVLLWSVVLSADGQAPHFKTGDQCMACHNGLIAPDGRDVSIGSAWRGTMMANSARDPYWQAAVRREISEHKPAAQAIEEECSRCHMPMANIMAHMRGGFGQVFANLPPDGGLAADGVSCALCHQMGSERLGQPETFTGHFPIDTIAGTEPQKIFGPHKVAPGLKRVMESAVGFEPAAAEHMGKSEFCASCHTLITNALDAEGNVIGRLPEQVPFLEWQHSEYNPGHSCQSCHMREIGSSIPISSVLGPERPGVNEHLFQGGNFFILRMLAKYRSELGVEAPESELNASASGAIDQLSNHTAGLTIEEKAAGDSSLDVIVAIRSDAGHKLPTAYPSRRVWVQFTVLSADGKVVFESGALNQDGSISGNDNDKDPTRYEPHYTEVSSPQQVQIYEAILGNQAGTVTTGLLHATKYLKDNRLLPAGFDKSTAPADIAVAGKALKDNDFTAGGDRIRYVVDIGRTHGPYTVRAVLWYQPIGYRWALNLEPFQDYEPQRFVRFYKEMSGHSAQMLTRAELVID